MFRISRDKLQCRCTTKPIQSTEEMFEALGFNNLVDPGVKVKMSTAFNEVFKNYARIVQSDGGGEKVFAFDAHLLIESMCLAWAELYGTMATFHEEVLRDKTLLKQEVRKLSDNEDRRVEKLAGELNLCRQKLREVQDALAKRRTTILSL